MPPLQWLLNCFKKSKNQETRAPVLPLQSAPSSHDSRTVGYVENGIDVYPLPVDPNATEEDILNVLKEVSENTGFPVDLLRKMRNMGGMTSIRTSDTAIPRDSLIYEDEQGNPVLAADYKSTGIGTKSNLQSPCAGKIPLEERFLDRLDYQDRKDNNSASKFPERQYKKISDKDTALLSKNSGWNIEEARNYNGLIYFKMKVAPYIAATGQLGADLTNSKHYCQEAETFRSIFSCLKADIYRNAQVITIDGRVVLQFEDKPKIIDGQQRPPNTYRVNLGKDEIIIPAALATDRTTRVARQRAAGKIATIKGICDTRNNAAALETLEQFVTENDLLTSHVALFAEATSPSNRNKSDKQKDFIPVMVQAGDNGEPITRDSDFEHFYKHPLVPPLANKSYNGGKELSDKEHIYGLKLLEIRLKANSLVDFKSKLDMFIDSYISDMSGKITLSKHAIEALKDQGFLKDFQSKEPDFKMETIDLAGFPNEERQRIFLAKYNDVTTLGEDMPFVNYNNLDFAEYISDVEKASKFYSNPDNSLALNNCGQSSSHDLVFLHKLGHPMAQHGDEAGHPKAKPEKFSRITTFVDGKFKVSNNEEQYLQLLFSRPELLDKQVLGVHPYWLRKRPADEPQCNEGWADLLLIQALKHGLLMHNQADASLNGSDLLKGVEIFAKTMYLNMEPKFGNAEAQRELQVNIQIAKKLFSDLQEELKECKPGDLEGYIQKKVSEIYSKNQYNTTSIGLRQRTASNT